MVGLNGILSIVGWYDGDFKDWDNEYFRPNGFSSVSMEFFFYEETKTILNILDF